MPVKKIIACLSVSNFTIFSESYSFGSVSDYKIINILPVSRSNIDGKSYFQKKTSLRQHIASPALMRIADAELAVRRVMSANGNTHA